MPSKLIGKSFALFVSSVGALVVGFIVSMINTRMLSPEEFGAFKFIQQAFSFLAVFMSLGVSYSVGRMLAINQDIEKERNLTGVTLIFYLLISVFTSIIICIIALIAQPSLSPELMPLLIIASPFVVVAIFNPVINNLLQGLNYIYLLATFRLIPQLIYIILIVIYTYMASTSLEAVVIISYASAGIVSIFCWLKLNSKFCNLRQTFKYITQENKNNGMPVYVGSLAAVGTANILGVVLGLYIDLETLGYYSLALMISSSLQLIPSVIATTLFKTFATSEKIPSKLLILSFAIAALSLLIFYIFIDDLVFFVYTEEYKPVIQFAKIMAVGSVLHGLGDVFNRFLGAHGQGRKIRNGALLSGGWLLIGCYPALTILGGVGVPVLKASGSCVYFATMLYYYLNTTRKKHTEIALP